MRWNQLLFQWLKTQARMLGAPQKLAFLISSGILATFLLVSCSELDNVSLPFFDGTPPPTVFSRATLGVASKIYVVSLPTRHDRRQSMERLRATLGLKWTYVDAIESTNPLIPKLLDWVKNLRTGPPVIINEADPTMVANPPKGSINFTWPSDIDELSYSRNPIKFRGVGRWSDPSRFWKPMPDDPIVCTTRDYDVAPFDENLPEYLELIPNRVACWHSHLSVIHDFANNKNYNDDAVAIIFEDDIDMERDIHSRLKYLWEMLPADWDSVFLGHCWDNESHFPALVHLNGTHPDFEDMHLHPSESPKCTHAYVLSRPGARRILQHLLYPPFAYSRAIDQALAWLAQSGRIKSFSVMPSIVVQRKKDTSDVTPGLGRGSKDALKNPFFND